MTHIEARRWQAYMEQRGTLNLGLRIEAGFALLATQINRALGGKAKIEDFLPQRKQPDTDVAASAQDIFALLTNVAGHNERVRKPRKGGKR